MPKISVPDIQKFQILPRKHASLIFHFFFLCSLSLYFFSFFLLLGGGGGEGGSSPLIWVTRGGARKWKKFLWGGDHHILHDLGATRQIPPAPSTPLKMNGNMIFTSNADTGKLSGRFLLWSRTINNMLLSQGSFSLRLNMKELFYLRSCISFCS